ncbi:MAG: S8 family serine peptidase [bacterium]|nr:S8 family serine peptidase [bacterium]
MKKTLIGLLLIVVLGGAFAWPAPDAGQGMEYFVALKPEPALMTRKNELLQSTSFIRRAAAANQPAVRTYAQKLRADQDTLLARIQQFAPQAQVGRRFTDLVNGFTIQADETTIASIRELPGVEYVSPVKTYHKMLTESGQWMMLPGAWDQLGGGEMAGDGVFVAIIDTGIDSNNPMFRGDGFSYPDGFPKGDAAFTNGKIIASRVFEPSFGNKGDTSNYDIDGHGSNVASIAAGNLNVNSPLGPLSGIAPHAYLGAYKVFTLDGATDAQIIAAVEAAVKDGADVINLSLGSTPFGDSQHDPQIQAIRNAIAAGVVVCIAAGNDGRPATVGNPSQIEEAITVGAVTNSHTTNGEPSPTSVKKYNLRLNLWVNGQLTLQNELALFGAPAGADQETDYYEEPIIGVFPIVDADTLDGGSTGGASDGLGCASFPANSVPDGTWVLVQRGDCLFVNKANNVRNAGGSGVLYYQNDRPDTDLIIPDAVGLSIPTMLTSRTFGLAVKQELARGNQVAVEVSGDPIVDVSQTPNRLASFSSIGPSADYLLKPDVMAIGQGSFAAVQSDKDYPNSVFIPAGFIWMSGTSQATPRVTGLSALVRQRHPDWPPDWVKSAIVNTAQTTVTSSSGGSNATVLQRGNGRVDANAAVSADTVMVPASLSLGAYNAFEPVPVSRWIRVTNTSGKTCEYSIENSNASSRLFYTFSPSSFTLQPGEDLEIGLTAEVNPPSSVTDHEQRIQLTNLTTGKNYYATSWMRTAPIAAPQGQVLLIDDDEGANYELEYGDWLNQMGRAYTRWDVNQKGDYPTLNYMKEYPAVVWFMGGKSLNSFSSKDTPEFADAWNLRHLFESELQKYLGQGGGLFLSGQDFLDAKEDGVFAPEALGVVMGIHDNGATSVRARVGNPLGVNTLGTVNLKYPSGLDNFADVLTPVDSGIATPALYADGGLSRTVAVTVENCNYRAVFLAFPLETAESQGGLKILTNGLNWISEKSTAPSSVASLSPVEIDLDVASPPYKITIAGSGFIYEDGYRAWMDSVPLKDVTRTSCNQITGVLPDNVKPGVYSLDLLGGDGERYHLANVLKIVSQTRVKDWLDMEPAQSPSAN